MNNLTKQILFQSSLEDSRLSQLKRLYPNCFTKNGEFIADKFNQIIQEAHIPISKESYSLQWLGKSYAKALEKLPPETLLAEDTEHNTKPENIESQNLLIKGDNLEVLKHLRNAYSEQVKMIYIDPPYNTGSDGFVYQDDREFTAEQLAELGNMDLEAAQRVLDFTAKKSNSHSAWLTFMYPRLYIARELLKDDGVIFISIDDNEQAQLKILCDEVFGEENFVSNVIRRAKVGGGSDNKHFAQEADYSVVYAKNYELLNIFYASHTEDDLKRYKEKDESGYFFWDTYSRSGLATSTDDSLYYEVNFPDGTKKSDRWRRSQERLKQDLENGDAKFTQTKNGWNIHFKQRLPSLGKRPRQIMFNGFGNTFGTEEIRNLFGNKYIFDYPKPLNLIKFLIDSIDDKNILILDFFAGSGTTAHAVMKLNAEEGENGKRRFILVQLPEETDKKSEAYKAGYHTIFDITKARLEKSAIKIREEYSDYQGDLGFKIFETVDDFRMPILENEQGEMYPVQSFSTEQIQALLTTWRVFDGQALTDKVQTVAFNDYIAYLCDETLYLLGSGFESSHIKALIERLDDTTNHPDFAPKRIVLHGDFIESSKQKELAQAVQTYANKKNIHISLIARV